MITIWLCKNRATITPAAKNPTKATKERHVTLANVKQWLLQKRQVHVLV
jgi:hypothetical protein